MTTCTPTEANLFPTGRYEVPSETDNVNCLYPQTALGAAVAMYFNLNIADAPSMHITEREGEAIACYIIGLT